jgi:hypothetical protein
MTTRKINQLLKPGRYSVRTIAGTVTLCQTYMHHADAPGGVAKIQYASLERLLACGCYEQALLSALDGADNNDPLNGERIAQLKTVAGPEGQRWMEAHNAK